MVKAYTQSPRMPQGAVSQIDCNSLDETSTPLGVIFFLMLIIMSSPNNNTQGARGRDFMNTLKEHIRMHRPKIIVLLETHISGTRADEVCSKIGFGGQFRVDPSGYQGAIWVLWLDNQLKLHLGHKFTWVRGRTPSTHKTARLDRALCNVAWR
ncbi:hypothetical protein Cgig2_005310 [Carnegiea gigantea]|uniref:Uncharacterized protein n=1 Tax=Carnegiea gigantea TaxID=171969 RepID=A0A9Q1GLH1_9CARY|nr:hypothetical protein Cgig2_005310 [Carnegiea gigantea]